MNQTVKFEAPWGNLIGYPDQIKYVVSELVNGGVNTHAKLVPRGRMKIEVKGGNYWGEVPAIAEMALKLAKNWQKPAKTGASVNFAYENYRLLGTIGKKVVLNLSTMLPVNKVLRPLVTEVINSLLLVKPSQTELDKMFSSDGTPAKDEKGKITIHVVPDAPESRKTNAEPSEKVLDDNFADGKPLVNDETAPSVADSATNAEVAVTPKAVKAKPAPVKDPVVKATAAPEA